MVNTGVILCGVRLDNPIIAASGCFGYGEEFSRLYDLDVLGSFSFKGTTVAPRDGNPAPRIADAPDGMINSVGLQNPGSQAVRDELLPKMAGYFHKPVMANICCSSVGDYAALAEIFGAREQVGWLEVNISCPNVKCGGMSFGADPAAAAAVTKACREKTDKPIIMKLTPNAGSVTDVAKACEAAGADALSLINTVQAMRIDLRRRAPVLANVKGGLSGPAVLPIALRCVWDVYESVKIPLVGMGGVSTPADVIEMMLAGATAVEVGAANLVDPFACPKIIDGLPAKMEELGINSLSDIVGAAHG